MGNRAFIKFQEHPETGVYVHWNGGPESVLAFLDTCKARGYRSDDYGVARLAAVIHEFFGPQDGLSLGVGPSSSLESAGDDNGTYIVGPDWSIVDRVKGYAEVGAKKADELGTYKRNGRYPSEREVYEGIMAQLRGTFAVLQAFYNANNAHHKPGDDLPALTICDQQVYADTFQAIYQDEPAEATG